MFGVSKRARLLVFLARRRRQRPGAAQQEQWAQHKKNRLTDRHALGVDGAQVAVLKEVHDKVLGRLLQREQALGRPAERLGRDLVGRLAHLFFGEGGVFVWWVCVVFVCSRARTCVSSSSVILSRGQREIAAAARSRTNHTPPPPDKNNNNQPNATQTTLSPGAQRAACG